MVPTSLRSSILSELHDGVTGGHLGQDKTLLKLKERYYWPGHWNDVQDWCNTCAACIARKSAAPKPRAGLQSIQAGYPLQLVAIDILGPLPESKTGNSYILVAGDYFTRWMEAYPIPNQEAITVANKLVDEMFCRFSPPEQLHSDQGRQFESQVVREICKLLKIEKTRTTPYHPQSDGLVERFNRTLLNMLATCSRDHFSEWGRSTSKKKVCFAYNTSVQASTGYSPFYLMFGRQARLPVDLLYGSELEAILKNTRTVPDYVVDLKKSLVEAYAAVRETLGTKLQRQKDFYNRKVHGEPHKAGDLVMLFSPVVPKGGARKFRCPWIGPFTVLERVSEVTYRIQSTVNNKTSIVHFDRLKPCRPDVRNSRQEARIDSDRTHEVTPPGTHTQLIEDEEPMVAAEPHVGQDNDNPDVAEDNVPPVDQLDAPPVEPVGPAAVPHRYPERHRCRPDYY